MANHRVIVSLILFTVAVLVTAKSPRDNPVKNPRVKQGLEGNIPLQLRRSNFKTMEKLLTQVDLIQVLDSLGGPFTLLLPTEEAFSSLKRETYQRIVNDNILLRQILARHILRSAAHSIYDGMIFSDTLQGDVSVTFNITEKGVKVNDYARILGKIPAKNGIIYVIDKVLMFGSIPQVLKRLDGLGAAGTFTTFEKAIEITGLGSLLTNPRLVYTIFAPTDAAFNVLPGSTVMALMTHPTQLRNILLNQYIFPGVMYTAELPDNGQIKSLRRGRLPVTKNSEGTKVGTARVTSADWPALNGVVHVINSVQLPIHEGYDTAL